MKHRLAFDWAGGVLPLVALLMSCAPTEEMAPQTAKPDVAVQPTVSAQTAAPPQADNGRRRFEEMDANGDGLIQKEELSEERQQYFERMDQNGDGNVTREEMRESFFSALTPERRAERMMRMRDGDLDGKLTHDEFRGPKEVFDQVDTNSDGIITAEELTTAFKEDRSIIRSMLPRRDSDESPDS